MPGRAGWYAEMVCELCAMSEAKSFNFGVVLVMRIDGCCGSAVAEKWRMGEDGFMRGFVRRVRSLFDVRSWSAPSERSKQVSFTIAFVGLAAKMAKADGVAVAVEEQAFERCFYVPAEERANVKRVFELASQDVAGFDIYAERIARLFEDDRALLKDVFECLFNIAAADGVLHASEEAFLKTVAEKFGFSESEYQSVRHLFVRDPTNPFEVLGVAPDIPNDALRTHYLKLVRENHPDRLVAEGVPREFLVVADRKLATINAAYDKIQLLRCEKEAAVD